MRTEDEKTNGTKNTEKQPTKSKVTPFRFPYRESDDPVIDAFILQGLREEADEIEERMNSDPELSQVNPPDDQYDKIVARLKEMGIWEEDKEEENQTEEEHEKELEEARKEIAAANRGKEADGAAKIADEAEKTADGAVMRAGEAAKKTDEVTKIADGMAKTAETAEEKEMGSSSAGYAEICGMKGSEEKYSWEEDARAACFETPVSGTGISETPVSETEISGTAVSETEISGMKNQEKPILREDELYQMLSEKDREAIALGHRQQEKRKRRSRRIKMVVKRGGMVAAVFALLIGVSMNVSASRQWIVQMWGAVTEVFGARTVTNNVEETSAIPSTVAESLAAMEEIEEITGIPGLDFNYWPEGMEYLGYEIFDDYLEARVFYLYKELSISVYMKNIKPNETSYYVSDEDMELIDTIEILEGIEVKVWEENPGQSGNYYRAEFAYEDYRYIISGSLSVEQMEELVKNISFLSKSM